MHAAASLEEKHIRDILGLAIKVAPETGRALVVFDRDSPLSRRLELAYRAVLPHAVFLEFAQTGAAGIMAAIDALKPGDFVGIIQSSSFRLDEFRIRIELFKRGLATVEHAHLARMTPEQEAIYVDALAYDPAYYVTLGHQLKTRLDAARSAVVTCNGTRMEYAGPFEAAKLNVGDYTGMANVGGTFPIGEVFTEPANLDTVNGDALVFAFANTDHILRVHEPFAIHVEHGVLTNADAAPDEFKAVLDLIKGQETVLVREFGLGLNRAMGRGRTVNDITAFERMKGLHFSLGSKHPVYKKAGIQTKHTRYHIDVFIDVQRIELDGAPLFEHGDFVV